MSDEQAPVQESVEESGDRPQENIQAEFSRKFKNIQDSNQSLAEQNKALESKLDAVISQLSQPKQAQQPAPSAQDLEDLRYTDPDKYIELKQQAMESKIMDKVEATRQADQEKQQTLSSLAQRYPSLNDANSDLYKKAIANYGALPDNMKDTAAGYKLAIMEAVAELGASNVSKKPSGQDLDEFIGGGSSGSGSQSSSREKKEEISPKTEMVAKLMGLDTSDKKTREGLIKHSKRKNWNRYSS